LLQACQAIDSGEGLLRSWGKLTFAMGLRVGASVCYLALVTLIAQRSGAASAAELVYVFAIAFVSSNLGRYGADQQIAKNASIFRTKRILRAGSLISTHAVCAVTTVPVIAIAIHVIALSFGDAAKLAFLPPPLWVIALAAAGLALGQTASAAWQAAGFPTASVVVFPFATYALLALVYVVAPSMLQDAYGWSGAFTGGVGLGALFFKKIIIVMPPRLAWLRHNGYFYIMGLSFYISAWLPFVYLPSILSAADVVLLNLAVRLSSIQSLPSNAIAGYLMPQFAVHAERKEFAKIEGTMRQVITITAAFQVLYLVALLVALKVFPQMAGLNVPQLIPVFLILSVGQVINGLTGPVGPALLMLGQQRAMAFYSLFACVAVTIVGYWIAGLWGAIGFAVVVAFFVSLQNFVYFWLLTSQTGLNPFRNRSRP
jgi:O-antigen/teichoic acid export membrane protein